MSSGDGRYLVGLRPAHKRHGGLWEFPGGKVLEGETDAAALRRELTEELDVELVEAGKLLSEIRDPGSPFVIRFIQADVRGTPTAVEHDRVGWFTLRELTEMALAPSDARFVRHALHPERLPSG